MQKFIYFSFGLFFGVNFEANRRMPNIPISIFSTSMTRSDTAQNETFIDAVSCSKLKCPQMKCPDANGSKTTPSVRFRPCISAELAFSTSEHEDDKAQTMKGTTNYDANVENGVRDFGVGASLNVTPKSSGERLNTLKSLRNSAPMDGMNGLVFMLAFMTGVADVAMVLKYENFATMVC